MPSPSGAEGAPRLILVGTVHRFGSGQTKLRQLLAELGPAAVTLEMSPYALEYRLTRGPLLRRRLEEILKTLAKETGRPLADMAHCPAVAGIRDLLDLPFEYRAAAEYADATGAVLELIDLSDVSELKLRRVEEELITEDNLRALLAAAAPVLSTEGPAAARALVLGDRGEAVRQAFLAGRRGNEGIGRRDRHMALEVRRLLAACPGRLVHVGGWVHLIEDREGETLYSLLEDLSPRRVLLRSR